MKFIDIIGNYATAKVLTNKIDDNSYKQIHELCNQEFTMNSNIVIMPDVHAGKGCVIGTSLLVRDKVVPSLVGADIGCGVRVARFPKKNIDFDKFESFTRSFVNQNVSANRIKKSDWKKQIDEVEDIMHNLKASFSNDFIGKFVDSIGTLGGGNHFIEIDQDEDSYYLVIHTGSRFFGNMVCSHYQELAQKFSNLNNFSYLEGEYLENYLADTRITQRYAEINRLIIMVELLKQLDVWDYETFESVHNYIDFSYDTPVLRKGAVSANLGQELIIPINMRDGSLICIGKGNKEYNYTAPHGAGRLFSRSEAKEVITDEEYYNSMNGIYTKSLNKNNKAESCFAYKGLEDILPFIQELVEIKAIIKPIYNLKG